MIRAKRHVTKAAKAVKLDRIVYMLIWQLIYGHHNKSDNNSKNNNKKQKKIIIKLTMYKTESEMHERKNEQKTFKIYNIFICIFIDACSRVL